MTNKQSVKIVAKSLMLFQMNERREHAYLSVNLHSVFGVFAVS